MKAAAVFKIIHTSLRDYVVLTKTNKADSSQPRPVTEHTSPNSEKKVCLRLEPSGKPTEFIQEAAGDSGEERNQTGYQ